MINKSQRTAIVPDKERPGRFEIKLESVKNVQVAIAVIPHLLGDIVRILVF